MGERGPSRGASVRRPESPVSALLAPRSIAIVGASGRSNNPFARPLRYLVSHGYEGAIYPVNPRYEELHGRACYPSLDELPEPVDLVLLMVPADEVLAQIPAAAAAGAGVVIVFASGFGEAGAEGQAQQAELVRTARACGIRVLGPNCQGVVSVHERMAATFTSAIEAGLPRSGNVAYIGQSGAVGGSILSFAGERGIGIAAWASTGNQADISAVEIADLLVDDERIDVIALYLESPVDGGQMEHLTRRALERNVRIVVLQSGRSAAGARAAASHTGAIVGGDAEFRALADEFGIVLADDIQDFLVAMQVLSRLPVAAGRRVGIVTTSGGAGSLVADQLELFGLGVDNLSPDTRRSLAKLVPEFGSTANPVDVTAQLFRSGVDDDFVDVCRIVLTDPCVDALVVVLTMITGKLAAQVARGIRDLSAAVDKPLVTVWLAAAAQTVEARAELAKGGWPVVESPREAALAIDILAPAPPRTRRAAEMPIADLDRAVAEALAPLSLDPTTAAVLTGLDCEPLLGLVGVRQPRQVVVTSRDDAERSALDFDGPLVAKIQSGSVLHKTDQGGVVVGIARSEVGTVHDLLLARFAHVPDAQIVIQELIDDGPDLLIGLTRTNRTYPPLLTVGLGGTSTEILRDVVSRLAPVDAAGAREMLLSLRSAPLLVGYRNSEVVQLDAVSTAIAALSQLAVALGEELLELEINPLRIVGNTEPVALDVMIRLTGPQAEGP